MSASADCAASWEVKTGLDSRAAARHLQSFDRFMLFRLMVVSQNHVAGGLLQHHDRIVTVVLQVSGPAGGSLDLHAAPALPEHRK